MFSQIKRTMKHLKFNTLAVADNYKDAKKEIKKHKT